MKEFYYFGALEDQTNTCFAVQIRKGPVNKIHRKSSQTQQFFIPTLIERSVSAWLATVRLTEKVRICALLYENGDLNWHYNCVFSLWNFFTGGFGRDWCCDLFFFMFVCQLLQSWSTRWWSVRPQHVVEITSEYTDVVIDRIYCGAVVHNASEMNLIKITYGGIELHIVLCKRGHIFIILC